jgi:hypothetical protein
MIKQSDLQELNINRYMHDYIFTVAQHARLVEKMYLCVDLGNKMPEKDLKVLLDKTKELEKFGKEFRKRFES